MSFTRVTSPQNYVCRHILDMFRKMSNQSILSWRLSSCLSAICIFFSCSKISLSISDALQDTSSTIIRFRWLWRIMKACLSCFSLSACQQLIQSTQWHPVRLDFIMLLTFSWKPLDCTLYVCLGSLSCFQAIHGLIHSTRKLCSTVWNGSMWAGISNNNKLVACEGLLV